MTKEDLESSIKTLEILLIVFGVLVAIGVAGESVFGFKLWRKNSRLRVIQEREIANLGAVAAEANRKAEEERLARIKIEERVAWRRLTKDEQSKIGSRLRHFSGETASVWFKYWRHRRFHIRIGYHLSAERR